MFGKKGKGKKEKASKQESGGGKKRRLPPMVLFGGLLVCGLLVIFAIYFLVIKKGAGPAKRVGPLEKVTLGAELLTFAGNRLPGIHERLARLNDDIVLIEKEIKRIETIAEAYPNQRKITSSEIKIWAKAQKSLEKSLSTLEKKTEEFYVAYQVNQEKGTALMDSKAPDIEKSADTAIQGTADLTERLKPKETENGSFISKIKNKIKGFF